MDLYLNSLIDLKAVMVRSYKIGLILSVHLSSLPCNVISLQLFTNTTASECKMLIIALNNFSHYTIHIYMTLHKY